MSGSSNARARRIHLLLPLIAGLLHAAAALANPAHDSITEYTGPETCVACHQAEAESMFGSVHYQWSAPTTFVPTIAGNAGKAEKAFNTYCGTPNSSRRFTCASCHAGNGGAPSSVMSDAQLHNIDCLMCHQDAYKRKSGGPTEILNFTDYLGNPRSLTLPVEDANGSFQFVPDTAHMSISIVDAARTVHLPTRASCLRCHAYAAGSDGAKRGDLSSVSVDPPLTSDIHLSSAGANLSCENCHQFDHHRVAGRGLDLPSNDRPEIPTCTKCHTATPHDSSRYNNHANRIACQTCHIPSYAKDIPTEVRRDWTVPTWAAGLFGGQGGYKGHEEAQGNLTPAYLWFDTTSEVYSLGQVATLNTNGEYEMGKPRGSVSSAGAKIYPMKEHWSVSALHDTTGQLIPHATFTYFATGDWNAAVADGMTYAGLTGSWTTVDVHTYQTINHGVEHHDAALVCANCHTYYSGGAPVRMDLQGKLGYAPKGPETTICRQCHGSENYGNFSSIHSRHVDSKKYDCVWCHNFTRPERNLKLPSNSDSDGDHVVNAYDNCVSAANLDQADNEHDGIGDVCDTDDDNDGYGDTVDNCPIVENPTQADQDGDHVGDACDYCPGTPMGTHVDGNGCPVPVAADFDHDLDVDVEDFALLQRCLKGTGVPLDAGCEVASLDGDTDVDGADAALFAACLSGPGNPPPTNCQ